MLVVTVHMRPIIKSNYADYSHTRQDTTDGRLADFTPDGILADSCILHDLRKVPKFFYSDDVEKIRSRHSKVRAKVVVQFSTGFLHLRIKDVDDLRHSR
jgi:hypothetical protein